MQSPRERTGTLGEGPGTPPLTGGRRAGRLAFYAGALGCYAVAAAGLIYLARDRINPDAVAYIQNARHYAEGRLDLAVNGWFGPLISWLLVPAVWIGGNAIVWFRAYNAAFGLVLAGGAMRLTCKLAGDRWGHWAFAAALFLSLGAVGDEITPDLLAAAMLAWYFNASYAVLRSGGAGKSLAAGLLGGACYLSKAYPLMFVAGHMVLTFALRAVLARRGRAERGAAKCFAAAMAGILLAALPWAAAVSYHAGRPCISTIGRSVESWGPLPTSDPLPVHLLQQPRPGRITNWENPIEIPYRWGTWDVHGPWDRLSKTLQAVKLNAIDALWFVFRFDALGLLLAGWAAGAAACLLRGQRLADPASAGRLWACLSAAFYFSGFLPIFICARYLWPLWSLLLPVFASVLTLLAGPPRSPQLAATEPSASARPWRKKLAAALAGALLLSVAGNVTWYVFRDEAGPLRKGREASELRQLGVETAQTGLCGNVATNKLGQWRDDNWYRGLFTTYWAAGAGGGEAQFLGQFTAQTPAEIIEELRPFGPSTVLIFDESQGPEEPPLAAELLRRPEFRWTLGPLRIVPARPAYVPPWRVRVLSFEPPPRP